MNDGSAQKVLVFFLFAAVLAAGLAVFGDYGVSWDEIAQRNFGLSVHEYVLKGDQAILTSRERNYGPVFELFLVLAEKALGIADIREVFLLRHLLNFLLFFAGAIFFYLLCSLYFRSRIMAALGCAMLVLSPRVFANAFYNSKDIPCLVFFIISAYTMVRLLRRKTPWDVLAHSAACALLAGIRVAGIIMPALTLLLLLDDLREKRRGKSERLAALTSVPLFIIMFTGLTVLFWPLLWNDPVGNFMRAFREMRYYPYTVTVLYRGSYLDSNGVPWHYIPVWLFITTPLLYVLFFFTGLLSLASKLISNARKRFPVSREELIVLCWFFLPIAAVIAMGSALYDAWRQLFFIYPAFVLISLIGVKFLFGLAGRRGGKVTRALIAALIAASLAHTAFFMARHHPHQNVYFNALAGGMDAAKRNFDLDYWGLSYRQALEHIVMSDNREVIKVYVPDPPGVYNSFILPVRDRKRIVFVDSPEKADYFVTVYRWHPGEYPYGDPVYSVDVGGARIASVYRLR